MMLYSQFSYWLFYLINTQLKAELTLMTGGNVISFSWEPWMCVPHLMEIKRGVLSEPQL